MERHAHTSEPIRGRRAADCLIIALDVPTLKDATRVVDVLAAEVTWFKVGSELFTAAGPESVEMVLARRGKVFLDLKFHDIPRSVAAGVAAAARLGVAMMDVHVAAGEDALRAAARSLDDSGFTADPRVASVGVTSHTSRGRGGGIRPLLLGVTRLTSIEDGPQMVAQVVEASRGAQHCGLDGVIASPREAAAVKAACGSRFVIVTPGVRPEGSSAGDQRRTATAAGAVRAGADYLVVGRPVLQATDPLAALRGVIQEIDAALAPEHRDVGAEVIETSASG